MYPIKPGQTQRFECESCVKEFEVTYEPKAKAGKSAAKGIPDADVEFCPFCASSAVVPVD